MRTNRRQVRTLLVVIAKQPLTRTIGENRLACENIRLPYPVWEMRWQLRGFVYIALHSCPGATTWQIGRPTQSHPEFSDSPEQRLIQFHQVVVSRHLTRVLFKSMSEKKIQADALSDGLRNTCTKAALATRRVTVGSSPYHTANAGS